MPDEFDDEKLPHESTYHPAGGVAHASMNDDDGEMDGYDHDPLQPPSTITTVATGSHGW